jgi:hypothetical protein
MKVMWMKTVTTICFPRLDEGRMSLARMTQRAMVTSRKEPWVTRRKMVDALTPCLVDFGFKKEKREPGEDWESAGDWLPFVLVIGAGSGSEAGGSGSLSAGCLAGMDVDVW